MDTPRAGPMGLHRRARRTGRRSTQLDAELQNYVVCLNGGESRAVADGHVRWKLQPEENTLQVRSRNLFGVEGAPVTAMMEFE